jgi:hypothetical protein
MGFVLLNFMTSGNDPRIGLAKEAGGPGEFRHHATLCIAAYGFLISEREPIPPLTARATRLFPQFALREGYQPRGSAVAA